MLRPRITPCLLIRNKGLVKTTKFDNSKYVGDPINTVRIFNEKAVDELIVLDIDATSKESEPDYSLIKKLAAECRMPLCYGGGIKTLDQAKKIIGLGVEKIAISAEAIKNPILISTIANAIGSQSVVVVLDVKKTLFNKDIVFTHNGTISSNKSPFELALMAERFGAGEVVINSIDRDGMQSGYDLDLAKKLCDTVNLPLTIVGGAGSLEDIERLVKRCGVVGAAAGSLFVFKGVYKAVLISYPNENQKNKILSMCS
jgi:imidazole glycerol-phosphate synthase subunit HisF